MYHYTESGLSNVWLKNGYVIKKTPYGEGVSIQDVEGLHKLIGTLISQRPKLTGKELRFLRKEMELSQRALGEILGTSEQNISLWERRGNVPKVSARLTKLIYLEHINPKGNIKIRELIDRLNEEDARAEDRLEFEKTTSWKEAA